MSDTLNLSNSIAHYSGGYRELADALKDDFQPYDNSYSTNLNWSSGLFGTFSIGFNYNQTSSDGEDSRYVLALNMPRCQSTGNARSAIATMPRTTICFTLT